MSYMNTFKHKGSEITVNKFSAILGLHHKSVSRLLASGFSPVWVEENTVNSERQAMTYDLNSNLDLTVKCIMDKDLKEFPLDGYNRRTISKRGCNAIKCFGVNYDSVVDIADEYGVNVNSLSRVHIKDGYTIYDDYGKTIDKVMLDGFVFLGKKYNSKSALYAEYGVYDSIVRGRMLRGMSLEESILTPVKLKKYKNKYIINNKEYTCIADACRDNGVSANYIKILYRELKIPKEIILNFIIDYFRVFNLKENIKCTPLVMYNNKLYFSVEEFVKEIGLSQRDFTNMARKFKGKFTLCNGLLEIAQELKNLKVKGKEYQGIWLPMTEINKLGVSSLLRQEPIIEKYRHAECKFEKTSLCRSNFTDYKVLLRELVEDYNKISKENVN